MGSLKMGVGAQRDREDTPSRHLGIMATSGKAVWVIKAPNEDPNQGTRVQRPLAARMLAPCRGGPRHTAAQAPWTVCGRTRLHSIRGNSLPSWAKHARCRSCCLCTRDTATASTTSILAPFGASSRRCPTASSANSQDALGPRASKRSKCFPSWMHAKWRTPTRCWRGPED